MAQNTRNRRVAGRIMQIVATMLETRIKDPRLGFVTITDVRVTGDLQHAKIFYTVMGDEAKRAGTAAALRSATGIIRSEVGKGTGLRLTPSIEFVEDALPNTARDLQDAIVKAKLADEALAKIRETAQYAGEADPYKHADVLETVDELSAADGMENAAQADE